MGFKTRVVGKVAKALVEEGVLGGAMYENEIHEEMALHIIYK